MCVQKVFALLFIGIAVQASWGTAHPSIELESADILKAYGAAASMTSNAESQSVKITPQATEAVAENSDPEFDSDPDNAEEDYVNPDQEPVYAPGDSQGYNLEEEAELAPLDVATGYSLASNLVRRNNPMEHTNAGHPQPSHQQEHKGNPTAHPATDASTAHKDVKPAGRTLTPQNATAKNVTALKAQVTAVSQQLELLNKNQSLWSQVKTTANQLKVPHCPTADDFFTGSMITLHGLKEGGVGDDVHVLIDSASRSFHSMTNCMQRLFKDLKDGLARSKANRKVRKQLKNNKQKVVKKPNVVSAADAAGKLKNGTAIPGKADLSQKKPEVVSVTGTATNNPVLPDAHAPAGEGPGHQPITHH